MARNKTGHRAGMGASVRVSGQPTAGSSDTSGKPVRSTVKAANSAKGLQRSGVKVPKVNLSNEYGISVQKANMKSAVTQPAGKNLANNQGALTKKVSRFK